MRGGEAVRRELQALDVYPFPWETPPPGSEHFFGFGTVVTPALGTTVQVLQYNVKNNYHAAARAILFEYTGGAYNPGDFTWSITVNEPVGSSLANGVPWKDYVNVPFNVGSRQAGPWPVLSGELSIFSSKDQIRMVATNIGLGVGAPNYFCAALVGWEWPNA